MQINSQNGHRLTIWGPLCHLEYSVFLSYFSKQFYCLKSPKKQKQEYLIDKNVFSKKELNKDF